MDESINIFLSYVQEDTLLHEKLVKHLAILKNKGLISPWSEGDMSAGSDREQEIKDHFESADLILLLVSSDFVASMQHYEGEMQKALERHEAGRARVVPILLRSIDWRTAPFAHLQILPADGKPIDIQPNKDEAFTKITETIRDLIPEMLMKRGQEHLTMQRYPQAAQAYRNALNLRPTMISAHQGLSRALFALGEYAKALDSYNAILETDSQDASIYIDKGYSLFCLYRYKDALTAYEAARRLDPDAASAYGEKGMALDGLRKFKGDIATIAEQLLPSLQLTLRESARSSLTPEVKVAPSVGTLLVTYHGHDGSVLDVAWFNKENIFSIGNASDAANRVTPGGNIIAIRGNINIWRAMTGRTLWYSTINSAETVAWSRDRQRFAVTITDAARDPATLSTEANRIKVILGSDPPSKAQR